MSEQIEPGDGWRLLGPDEVIRKGDEVYTGSGWFVTVEMGLVVANYIYRRRIPAKPEAMEIDGHTVSLNNGSVRIGGLFSHYFFSGRTKAIRQLGEWLISVADWREAQGEAK
jgi:hypothetical protein